MNDLDELPGDLVHELRELDQGADEARRKKLDTLGQALAVKRDEAVKARIASGIETIWTRCEEAYHSIDDANRHEYGNFKWAKPMTLDGSPMKETTGIKSNQPTIYVGLTARYVNAGHAKAAEILLPPDDKAFSFGPTPVPELIKAKEDQTQVEINGIPLERDPKPEELPGPPPSATPPPGAAPIPTNGPLAVPPAHLGAMGAPPAGLEQAPGVPLKVKDLAEEQLQQAQKKAEKAENRVFDWMVEGRFRREARKALFDGARLGTAIVKGPYPEVRRKRAARKVQITNKQTGEPIPNRFYWQVDMIEKVVPGFKRVSPWDFFPAKNCGEDPKEGDCIFERDRISGRSLRKFKQQADVGYLPDQIDLVLKEGPNKKYANATESPTLQVIDNDQFELWYFTGELSLEDFRLLNPLKADEDEIFQDRETVPVIATMVNDTVIKAAPHPLEGSEEFNYHTMQWSRRDGYWAGIGIAEQVFTPASIVTGATRHMVDNAGKAAGPILIVDMGCISPGEGDDWELRPWKIFFKGPSATIDDVRKAFTAIEFPDRQQALQAIIEYGFKLAEECTNIPLITQGQSGKTTPETFGATEIQNNNANQLLRNVGYTWDDSITEPLVTQCYEWLLLDPDVPDDEKGDFDINARGSVVLVERAIQDQVIAQMAGIVKDTAFGINPRKWFAEYMKSKRLDPKKFQWSEQEQAKIDSQPPPKAPQVEAAEIRAQTDLQKVQVDTDRDLKWVEAETQRTLSEHQARMAELQLKKELALLDYSNKRGMSLEEAKASLAETAMKLKTQERLAAQDRAVEVLTPPTEPKGKAPKGQSFEK